MNHDETGILFEGIPVFFIAQFLSNPFWRSSIISGLSSVEVSPKSPVSPLAIFRNILLIIFPERVLGNPLTN